MSPVSQFPLISHYNLKSLKMTDGKRLFTQQSPNIMAGPICLYLLPRLTIRLYKQPLPTHQFSPLVLAKGWKSRPTMPLTKEKPLLPLPHPPMSLINMCPPRWIWGTIVLMWSARLGLKAHHNQGKIQRDQKVIAATRERFHLRVENMDFKFYFIYCWWQLTSEVLDDMFSFDIWVIYFWK